MWFGWAQIVFQQYTQIITDRGIEWGPSIQLGVNHLLINCVQYLIRVYSYSSTRLKRIILPVTLEDSVTLVMATEQYKLKNSL